MFEEVMVSHELTPPHGDVIQSTPWHGRSTHSFDTSGFGSGQSSSPSTSILPSFFRKQVALRVCVPGPHNLLHWNLKSINQMGTKMQGEFALTGFQELRCHSGQITPTLQALMPAGLFPTNSKQIASATVVDTLQKPIRLVYVLEQDIILLWVLTQIPTLVRNAQSVTVCHLIRTEPNIYPICPQPIAVDTNPYHIADYRSASMCYHRDRHQPIPAMFGYYMLHFWTGIRRRIPPNTPQKDQKSMRTCLVRREPMILAHYTHTWCQHSDPDITAPNTPALRLAQCRLLYRGQQIHADVCHNAKLCPQMLTVVENRFSNFHSKNNGPLNF